MSDTGVGEPLIEAKSRVADLLAVYLPSPSAPLPELLKAPPALPPSESPPVPFGTLFAVTSAAPGPVPLEVEAPENPPLEPLELAPPSAPAARSTG